MEEATIVIPQTLREIHEDRLHKLRQMGVDVYQYYPHHQGSSAFDDGNFVLHLRAIQFFLTQGNTLQKDTSKKGRFEAYKSICLRYPYGTPVRIKSSQERGNEYLVKEVRPWFSTEVYRLREEKHLRPDWLRKRSISPYRVSVLLFKGDAKEPEKFLGSEFFIKI